MLCTAGVHTGKTGPSRVAGWYPLRIITIVLQGTRRLWRQAEAVMVRTKMAAKVEGAEGQEVGYKDRCRG